MEVADLYANTLRDVEEMERLTEAKIQAAMNRQPDALVSLLQEQIDPMYRLSSRTLELGALSDAQRGELSAHIARWAQREAYLKDLVERNLGYIDYLKRILGLDSPGQSHLNIGL
jgi:hypothetical protein